KGTVSDGGSDAFYIANGTSGNNRFNPALAGYVDSTANTWSLNFIGATNAASDASDSSNFGLIRFNTFRSNDASDPLNGSLSAIQNRKLFTFENLSTPLMTILASGNVGIGDTTPAAMFTVGSGDLFQVNSSGAIAAATGI